MKSCHVVLAVGVLVGGSSGRAVAFQPAPDPGFPGDPAAEVLPGPFTLPYFPEPGRVIHCMYHICGSAGATSYCPVHYGMSPCESAAYIKARLLAMGAYPCCPPPVIPFMPAAPGATPAPGPAPER